MDSLLSRQFSIKTLSSMSKQFDKEERHFFKTFNNAISTIALNKNNLNLLNEKMQIILQINQKQTKEQIDYIKQYNKYVKDEIDKLEFLRERKGDTSDLLDKIQKMQNNLLPERDFPIFIGFAKLIDIKFDKSKQLKQLTLLNIESLENTGFKIPISESQKNMLHIEYTKDNIITTSFGSKHISIFKIKNQKELEITVWLPL